MRPRRDIEGLHPGNSIKYQAMGRIVCQPHASGLSVWGEFLGDVRGFVGASMASVMIRMGSAEARVQPLLCACSGWFAAADNATSREHVAGGASADLHFRFAFEPSGSQSRVPLMGSLGYPSWEGYMECI